MFSHYLRVALRNLKHQKMFTSINIFGMALGIAGFTLFVQAAAVKLNADRFHVHAERIFGVVQVRVREDGKREHSAFQSENLLPSLIQEIPDIQAGVRVRSAERFIIRRGGESFNEHGLLFVDSDFFRVFSFRLAAGDPETALMRRSSILISEAAAEKYFGREDPLGKILVLENKLDLIVTGVFRNFPRTSSLRFEFLAPLSAAPAIMDERGRGDIREDMIFLLLPDRTVKGRLEELFPAFLARNEPSGPGSAESMYLYPFLDFRLKSRHITSGLASSHPISVLVPFLLGVMLLIVVSINFINLATVRSLHRAREIGLRKVVGARRCQLTAQFLGESILLAALAIPPAVLFYEALHPVMTAYLGSVTGMGIVSKLSSSIWNYPFLLKYMVAAALLTGLFSGLYPALILSSLRSVRILKGDLGLGRKKRRGSKFLIAFQFTLSIVIIAGAAITHRQASRFGRADFGFNRERIGVVPIPLDLRSKIDVLRGEILRHPDVMYVSGSAGVPLVWTDKRPVRDPEAEPENALDMNAYGVGIDFTEALEMPLLSGRGFTVATGSGDRFILNRTAARRLGWTEPLGRMLEVGDRTGTVIGVTEDFLFDDIGFGVPPAVLYLEREPLPLLLVKFGPSMDESEFMRLLREKWTAVAPGLPFSGFTLDEHFEETFRFLDRIAGFLGAVGLTVVLFACMGLLGMASFLVKRRTKEIGIRKVMGASTVRVSWLILKEYFVLIAAANLIAMGLVHFGWHKALQSGLLFLAPIGAGIPIFTMVLSFLAALAAVGVQVLSAARADPVDGLRAE